MYESERVAQQDEARRVVWEVIAYRFEVFVCCFVFVLFDF